MLFLVDAVVVDGVAEAEWIGLECALLGRVLEHLRVCVLPTCVSPLPSFSQPPRVVFMLGSGPRMCCAVHLSRILSREKPLHWGQPPHGAHVHFVLSCMRWC
eukprot:7391750-Prymnesium_polylepis.1